MSLPQLTKQYFYVYEIENGTDEDGFPHKNVIVERITFLENWKPAKLDIPGWRGWLEDLVMAKQYRV